MKKRIYRDFPNWYAVYLFFFWIIISVIGVVMIIFIPAQVIIFEIVWVFGGSVFFSPLIGDDISP